MATKKKEKVIESPTLGVQIADLSKIIDKLNGIRKLEKSISELKTQKEIEIIRALEFENAEGARTELGSVKLRRETVASVKDWVKFYSYIYKNKAFDLLQKRVGNAAYRARIDDGKKIPGVEPYLNISLAFTKSK